MEAILIAKRANPQADTTKLERQIDRLVYNLYDLNDEEIVALYAPDVKYLGAICTPRCGRLSKVFLDIDGDHFRSLMRFIQARFEEQSEKLRQSVLSFVDIPQSVIGIARSILPPDDSSLQWSEAGGGITDDPSTTLEGLYDRMVHRYEESAKLPSRDDDEVWRHSKRD